MAAISLRMSEHQPRKLAAIFAADIAGYSALMGADEAGTVRDLKQHQAVVLPMISEFGGRVIDTAGDGILAEFASVVEAVQAAVAIQHELATRNARVEPSRKMHLRIGINFGDVIFDRSRIYGDGINVAARLEALSPAGGICISSKVYDEVRGKIELACDDLGEQQLKNIAHPVRVYSLRMDSVAAPKRPAHAQRRRRGRSVAGLALLAAVTLAGVIYFAVLREQSGVPHSTPPVNRGVVNSIPVVAVLPFTNQTGDERQDYFADGMTQELINALGRFGTLRVMGHNSVLRYKGRAPAHQEIVAQLGASYLIAGTESRSGKRVRIAAQLTELPGGTVMWSNRYDGELADVFEFQDAIAREIAGTLAANITQVEGRRSLGYPKPNPNAFDLALRARALGHASTRAANRRFRELIAEAIEMDPAYAAARALLAEALFSQAILGWTEFPDRVLSRGADEARQAIALAPEQPDGHRALGRILLARAEYDRARDALKRAVEINPSDANALAPWGAVQCFTGEISAGIESLELALKLDAMLEPNYVFDLAIAYYLAGRHPDALRLAEQGLARYPDFPMLNVPAAAAAARLGRQDLAGRHVDLLRRRLPMLDLDSLGSRFKDPIHRSALREGLSAAGW